MNLSSGDHATRLAIITARSPKSVSFRIGPPAIGNPQMLAVWPSIKGNASILFEFDRMGTSCLGLTGMRVGETLSSSTAVPVGGVAFRMLVPMTPAAPPRYLTKYIVAPPLPMADA